MSKRISKDRTGRMRAMLAATLIAVAATLAPVGAGVATAETASTDQREQDEKAQKKKDKEFNRDILYRHVVGPKVLALGPYSISLFVRGQPLEARLRVAVQTTSELARTQLEAQKMSVNGIVYPLAVRLFELGRPSSEQIRAFKDDTRAQLVERYPDLIEDVFIESMI